MNGKEIVDEKNQDKAKRRMNFANKYLSVKFIPN